MKYDAAKYSLKGVANDNQLELATWDQRVVLLYSNASRAIPFNIVVSLILIYLIFDVVPVNPLLIWFSSIVVLSIIRLAHIHYTQQLILSGSMPTSSLVEFSVGSTATGLLWGLGYVFVYGYLPLHLDLLFLWAMGGLAAGAFTSMSSYHRVYVMFLLAMFIPVIAIVILGTEKFTPAMSMFGLMYIGMLLTTHRVAESNMLKGIRSTLEKEDLALYSHSQEDALRVSQSLYSEAQKIAKLGHWTHYMKDNSLQWSDEVYRLIEVDPDRFDVSYDAFLGMVHPDDMEYVYKAYTESVENHSPYNIEHRLLMKDGRIKYVNQQCYTEYDNDGKPMGSVGTIQDITERKQAELERERLQRELQQVHKMEALGKMTIQLQLQEQRTKRIRFSGEN